MDKADFLNKYLLGDASLQKELGTRLHEKITKVVIPEWEAAFKALTLQDCIDYIYNLTINRTYDGYITEKSVVHDNLAKIFPQIKFEESPAELDHAGDVDYVGYITDEVAFGIQIKPTTAKANFGNYSISERMRANFEAFKDDFGGEVFIVFSEKGEVSNPDVIQKIEAEILRLKKQA